MKLSTPFLLVLAAVGIVDAASHDGLSRMAARHHNVARSSVEKRASGRCKARPTTTSLSSTSTQEPTSTSVAPSSKKSKPTALTNLNSDNKSSDSSNSNSNNGGNTKVVSGLIKVTDWHCGSANAQKQVTATAGPNGQLDWFNCGVDGNGWSPPYVSVSDIVTSELADAIQQDGSPFKACAQYVDTFYKYASQHGLPAILLASIAMQESSCNPETVGGGGEQGLMQITKDKCGGAPNGNCRDVDFNIRTGAAFFAQTLQNNGGSLLKTFGNYNGWQPGLTVASATAARWSPCCRCQNNLDYLHQVMNGWLLNVNPYSAHMGKYFNLDVC